MGIMVPDPDAAYLALKARDARFDGRLFVGVTSTGVYCRPVCRVRTPRRENCRFFASAAQAEAASFRPCLKCRPEIAPGLSAMDSSASLAASAARLIEHAIHAGEPVALPGVAVRLGVTERHLRRIFQAAHGVAPRDYVATQRLLLAKQLLTDTAAPVTEVALASGFDSLRRFNAAFAERYRMSPTRLRRDRAVDGGGVPPASASGDPMLRLAYRPPYDAAAMLAFLAARALPGVEQLDGDGTVERTTLRRTLGLTLHGSTLDGWIALRFVPARCEVRVQASPSLAPALGQVLQRVRHALDLDADPARVDPVLDPHGAASGAGTRLPGAFDPFETAVRIVLGQQVSVRAAGTLARRLVQAFGVPVETPFPGLTHRFPDAATLAAAPPDAIGRLGIVRQRVRALQALAAAVADGALELRSGAALTPTLVALRALPGIGEWTAQMIAMRVLAWPDAFPASDIGVLNALGTRDPKRALAAAERWRPWRAYAVMRLWQAPPPRPAMEIAP
jgi:AraC family transcriptional regulator of adaptative response / DNA-3-methyladenine glycosylase II